MYRLLVGTGVLLTLSVVVCSCAPRYVYERAHDGVGETRTVQIAGVDGEYPQVEGYVTLEETGVQLWFRRTGETHAPAVVLINGADFASHWWHPAFVGALLEAGFHVVQYDQRDCGRSEYLPFPRGFRAARYQAGDPPPYPITAFSDDLVGLMAALEIDDAHLVGVSLGGIVAQLTALDDPERVRTLTLLSTSPSNAFDEAIDNPDDEHLMVMGDQFMKAAMAYYTSPGDKWMGLMVAAMQTITGASDGGDDFLLFLEENRAVGGFNFKSSQGFAIASSPSRIQRLPDIAIPTLILHGTEDPWFRYSHAQMLDELIPDSRLIAVEGQGHAMPRSIYNPYLEPIVEHLLASD